MAGCNTAGGLSRWGGVGWGHPGWWPVARQQPLAGQVKQTDMTASARQAPDASRRLATRRRGRVRRAAHTWAGDVERQEGSFKWVGVGVEGGAGEQAVEQVGQHGGLQCRCARWQHQPHTGLGATHCDACRRLQAARPAVRGQDRRRSGPCPSCSFPPPHGTCPRVGRQGHAVISLACTGAPAATLASALTTAACWWRRAWAAAGRPLPAGAA